MKWAFLVLKALSVEYMANHGRDLRLWDTGMGSIEALITYSIIRI